MPALADSLAALPLHLTVVCGDSVRRMPLCLRMLECGCWALDIQGCGCSFVAEPSSLLGAAGRSKRILWVEGWIVVAN